MEKEIELTVFSEKLSKWIERERIRTGKNFSFEKFCRQASLATGVDIDMTTAGRAARNKLLGHLKVKRRLQLKAIADYCKFDMPYKAEVIDLFPQSSKASNEKMAAIYRCFDCLIFDLSDDELKQVQDRISKFLTEDTTERRWFISVGKEIASERRT